METFDLKAFMDSVDFADYEIAEKLSIAASTFNAMKNGKSEFKRKYVVKLAALFPDIDMQTFMVNKSAVKEAETAYNPNSSLVMHSFIEQGKALDECRKENAALLKQMMAMQSKHLKEIEALQNQKATLKGESPIHKQS